MLLLPCSTLSDLSSPEGSDTADSLQVGAMQIAQAHAEEACPQPQSLIRNGEGAAQSSGGQGQQPCSSLGPPVGQRCSLQQHLHQLWAGWQDVHSPLCTAHAMVMTGLTWLALQVLWDAACQRRAVQLLCISQGPKVRSVLTSRCLAWLCPDVQGH